MKVHLDIAVELEADDPEDMSVACETVLSSIREYCRSAPHRNIIIARAIAEYTASVAFVKERD